MSAPLILCNYRGESCLDPEIAGECLAQHFRGVLRGVPAHREPGVTQNAPLPAVITQIIFDVVHARAITAASETNRSFLETRIADCIRRQEPIAAHMLWSPRKHWVNADDSVVDLAELAALDTLHAVHAAVRAVYPPGMRFHLEVEDIEFEFIEGCSTDLMQASERYLHGLRRLVDVLGIGGAFCVVKVSDKAAGAADLVGWREQMAENYRVLEAYWNESERAGIDRCEHLPSYRTLCDLGWVGPIPAEMRRQYLNRLWGLSPQDEAAKVAMVLRNLAGILLHRQKGLGSGRRGTESIKFSFVPPARGAPQELLNGRVDLRYVSRKICSRVGAAGPWSTKGYLHWRNARLAPVFAGWQQVRASGARYHEGRINLDRDGESVDVRADYLVA